MLGIGLLLGLAAAFNFLILKWKFEHGRYGDVALDIMSLVILSVLFGNSILGLIIATLSSMMISLYLLFNPPGANA